MADGNSLNEEIVLKQLYFLNDWWSTGSVPTSKAALFRRRDIYFIQRNILQPEILALVGPRQVGKTTLLYQTVDYLIKEKRVNPQNILFVSLDNEVLKLNTKDFLEDVLNTYFKNILKSPIKESKQRVYLFLDEIQALDGWNQRLKDWSDQKLNLKIVISGSSSTTIKQGSEESLAGRLSPQTILPLKFLEVVRFKEVLSEDEIKQVNFPLREKLQEAIDKKDASILFDELSRAKTALIPKEQSIQIALNHYFINGGYPGLQRSKDAAISSRNLENYVQSAIYRDIVQLYDLRSPKTLEALITMVAQNGIRAMARNNIAKNLGIRVETVESYLDYLERAYLISESEYYATNLTVRKRNPKKIYFIDPGIRNAILHQVDDNILQDSTEMGYIAENICQSHCRRLTFNLKGFKKPGVTYWKDKTEIDIVLEGVKSNLPIEVKYAQEIRSHTIEEMYKFIETNDSPFGIIITKTTFENKGNVLLIPMWLFLLIV